MLDLAGINPPINTPFRDNERKASLTAQVLITHYPALAEASPIPLLAYNVPAFTGIDFAPSTLLKMAEHPRIVGFKDRSANLTKVASVLAVRPEFQVLAGTPSVLLPFLILGAAGGIMALANFAAATQGVGGFPRGPHRRDAGGPAFSGSDRRHALPNEGAKYDDDRSPARHAFSN